MQVIKPKSSFVSVLEYEANNPNLDPWLRTEARFFLGVFYKDIRKDDFDLAALWLVSAAKDGYLDAQFELADLYRRGLGVPQSDELALKWFKVAASRGHTGAQRILKDYVY